ncbi:MAG: DsbE family thiol:disulfide interchange protein [Alphaproteobacteria bacterium]|nr:DsbE family thiol:disulfide interchange protein [Alphaproteobacteria bacterium]
MFKRLPYLLPIIILIAVVFYFGWTLKKGQDPSFIPSALVNQSVPVFNLPVLDQHNFFTQNNLEKKITIINFFASWCIPCEAEIPILRDLVEKEKYIKLIGIGYKDDPIKLKDWLIKLGNPYHVVILDEGKTAIDFGIYGIPETFILDQQGIIRYHHAGPLEQTIVSREIIPTLHNLAN